MNLQLFKPTYNFCFDTGAFINLKDRYPFPIFKNLWVEMDKLVKSDCIHSPEEVLRELEKYDDDIYRWASRRKDLIFKSLDIAQIVSTKKILSTHPLLLQEKKEKFDADAFVVGYAHAYDATVVSLERFKKQDEKRPRIPDVCHAYDIEHVDLIGFFKKIGLRFK